MLHPTADGFEVELVGEIANMVRLGNGGGARKSAARDELAARSALRGSSPRAPKR